MQTSPKLPGPQGLRDYAAPFLGIPSSEAQPALQTDAYKELVNKLAWVIGSTYHVPYGNVRTGARQWAMILAQTTHAHHGYPARIGFPK